MAVKRLSPNKFEAIEYVVKIWCKRVPGESKHGYEIHVRPISGDLAFGATPDFINPSI